MRNKGHTRADILSYYGGEVDGRDLDEALKAEREGKTVARMLLLVQYSPWLYMVESMLSSASHTTCQTSVRYCLNREQVLMAQKQQQQQVQTDYKNNRNNVMMTITMMVTRHQSRQRAQPQTWPFPSCSRTHRTIMVDSTRHNTKNTNSRHHKQQR